MHPVVFFDDIIENFERRHPIRPMPKGVSVVFSFKGSATIPTFKVCHYKNEAFIWFRGTRVYSWNDIIIDVSAGETEFLGGLCHKGYLEGSRMALNLAMPYITNKDRIVTMGHSLGGACAAVSAMILKMEKGWSNVHAFTLACPGILDLDLANKTRTFITTFVRKNDPIPRIFRAKRGVYATYNAIAIADEQPEFKWVSADYVPGRIIMLDENEKGETIARRPCEEDYKIKATNAVSFIAHCQRLYLRDINRIYGIESNEKPIHSTEKTETKYLKEIDDDEDSELEEYEIRKPKKKLYATLFTAGTIALIAALGPPGFVIGGSISCASFLFYKYQRRKYRIYPEEDTKKNPLEERQDTDEYCIAK